MTPLEKLQASGVLDKTPFAFELDGQKVEGVVRRHAYKPFLRLIDEIDAAETYDLFCRQFSNPDGTPFFPEGFALQEKLTMPAIQKFMEAFCEASTGKKPPTEAQPGK